MPKLNWDVDLNGESIDATVHEDTTGDGNSDNSETVSLTDGSDSTTLSTISDSSDWWITVQFNTSIEGSKPVVNSLELEVSTPSPVVSAERATEVDITWSDIGASEYDVYRAESTGMQLTDYTKIADVSGTTYTDTGLENGKTYHYVVTEDGLSEYSGEAVATTVLPAPTLNSATGGNRQAVFDYTINDNSSEGVLELLISSNGDTYALRDTISDLSSSSFTDTSLVDGRMYYYKLRRDTGDTTADSADTGITTDLPAPTLSSVSQGSGFGQMVLGVSKNDNNPRGDLNVFYSEDGSRGNLYGSEADDVTEITVDGLENGEKYWFTIERDTGDGAQADSGQDSGITKLQTVSITFDTSTENEVGVQVSPDDNSSDGGIRIFKSDDGSKGTEVYSNSNGNSDDAFTDTSVVDGREYWYTVERFTDHNVSSIQDSGVSYLPPATINSVDTSTLREITIDFDKQDDNPTGRFDISYTATTSGTTDSMYNVDDGGMEVTIEDLIEGEEYRVVFRRYTDSVTAYGDAATTETINVTKLSEPTISSIDDQTERELSLSLVVPDNNDNGGIRIYQDSVAGLTEIADISKTSMYTDDGLADGREYTYYAERYTNHATTTSPEETAITILPDVTNIDFDHSLLERIVITWNRQDNNPNGEIEVFRSKESGRLTTWIANGLSPSTETTTDTDPDTGTQYYYTIVRKTGDARTETEASFTSLGINGPKTKMSWHSSQDWDMAQSRTGLVHHGYSGSNEDSLKLGFPDYIEDLIAFYDFYGTSGPLIDRIGDRDGTPNSGITFDHQGVNGGNSWYFDGTTDAYIDLPKMGIFGDSAITFIVNYKVPITNTSEHKMLMTMGGDDPEEQFAVMASDNCQEYKYSWGVDTGGNDNYYETIATPSAFDNQWSQVAYGYDPDGNDAYLWHNGQLILNAGTPSLRLQNHRYKIGSAEIGRITSGDPEYTMEGYISEAAVVGRCITNGEAEEIFDSMTSGSLKTSQRGVTYD